MDLLEVNLEILKRRYPELSNLHRRPEGIEILRSKSGHPSVVFKKILLHSEYDPVKEAKRLIDRVDLKGVDIVFVFGFGLGYHLKELLQRVDPEMLVLAIEPEPDLFFIALSSIDLNEILVSPLLELSIGERQEGVLERISRIFDPIKTRRTLILEHPPSLKLNRPYFEELRVKIQNLIDQRITQALTVRRFGYDFQRNIIRNLIWLVEHPGVKELFGRFKSLPAIIIAAGPSLDREIEVLREAEDKALLISVDTALGVLLDRGLTPDLVVTVDPQEVNLRYLEGKDLSNLFLVMASVAYWKIGQLPCPKFASLTDHPLCRWLAKFDDKGSVDLAGGSVTTASFDLAVKMGADPIILVGTDFAYSEDLTYTRSLLEEDINRLSKFYTIEMMRREPLVKDLVLTTEGVQGRRIFTNKVLYGYLIWLKERIRQLESSRKIINTAHGAKIPGTLELELREVLRQHCLKSLSPKEGIREIWKSKPKIDPSSFIQEIEVILEELAEIEKFSCQKKEEIERLRGVTEKGGLNGLGQIEEELKDYHKTLRLLEIVLYSATFDELYKAETEGRSLDRSLIWAKGFNEVSSFTLGLFREARDNLTSKYG